MKETVNLIQHRAIKYEKEGNTTVDTYHQDDHCSVNIYMPTPCSSIFVFTLWSSKYHSVFPHLITGILGGNFSHHSYLASTPNHSCLPRTYKQIILLKWLPLRQLQVSLFLVFVLQAVHLHHQVSHSSGFRGWALEGRPCSP